MAFLKWILAAHRRVVNITSSDELDKLAKKKKLIY